MKASYYIADTSVYKDYRIGVERIGDILPQISAMHHEHWAETEVLYLNRPPDIDYERIAWLESQGNSLLFTVRDDTDGTLVGNLLYYLGYSTHFKGHKTATEDAFYLSPSVRRGGLAAKLLEYAEVVLKEQGVTLVGMSDKAPTGGKSLKPFMERQGYQEVATLYMKEI